MKKVFAEFFGTFWLVFGGCGSAIFAAGFPDLGIGFAGVALAFGLTVLTMAYAVGHISGGHFNPAVSIGLWAGGKFEAKELLGYIIAQVIGAIAAAGALYLIVSGKSDFVDIGGFAANGYEELTDAQEQEQRFVMDNAARLAMGKTPMAADDRLIQALAAGLPECAGVALGIERLLMLASGEADIAKVMAFNHHRA